MDLQLGGLSATSGTTQPSWTHSPILGEEDGPPALGERGAGLFDEAIQATHPQPLRQGRGAF